MRTRRLQSVVASKSTSLRQLAADSPPLSEHILLYCFGSDLTDNPPTDS